MKNLISDLKLKDNVLSGFFRGIVEDRNDPEKLGRCRIRVFGVHTDVKQQSSTEGVPTEHLPWAEPATSPVEGGVSGFGLWSIPLQGAQVLVFFEEGNIMKPMYMASLPGRPEESSKGKKSIGFYDPQEKYPIDKKTLPHEPNEKYENDMHKLATGDLIEDTIVKTKNDKRTLNIPTSEDRQKWDEPASYYGAEYPDNIVFATHSGITIEVDNTKNGERIHIYHPSNSYIEIGPAGDIVIRNAGDKFEIVDGNKKVCIKNDTDQTIQGNKTEYVQFSKTEKVDINQKETIGNNKKEIIQRNKDVRIYGMETKRLTGDYRLNARYIRLNCTVPEPNIN